ncbi:MAG: glycosyltransferase [Actinomycetota bacterium]
MSLRAIHQWVPSFAARDAVGGHARQIRRVVRDELGLESDVYVVDAQAAVRSISSHYRRHRPDDSGESAVLYHLSVGSEMADALLDRPEPLLVDYHNITPAHFFDAWEPAASYSVTLGRRQIPSLARRTTAAIADSAYNEGELVAAGYRDTSVVPILLDTATFEHEVDEALARRLGDGGPLWLFVGRIAPNKAQHDIVLAFAAYRRHIEPTARLALVGGPAAHAYDAALRRLLVELDLEDAVELPGSVSDAELGAWYSAADLLVCLSDHEGFCVPLLEAMWNRVPILAYDATAVPETLGRGGVVLTDKSPLHVAVAADRILRDDDLRRSLVEAGTARLADFELERTTARLIEFLTPLVEGDGS